MAVSVQEYKFEKFKKKKKRRAFNIQAMFRAIERENQDYQYWKSLDQEHERQIVAALVKGVMRLA